MLNYTLKYSCENCHDIFKTENISKECLREYRELKIRGDKKVVIAVVDVVVLEDRRCPSCENYYSRLAQRERDRIARRA